MVILNNYNGMARHDTEIVSEHPGLTAQTYKTRSSDKI